MKCAEENLKYFPTETQQELANILNIKKPWDFFNVLELKYDVFVGLLNCFS